MITPGMDNAQAKEKYLQAVKSTFRPEFVNRLDAIIVFEHLTKEQLRKIADIQISRVAQRLSAKGIKLVVTQQALDLLGQLGYSIEFGARPLKRVIVAEVENRLADLILSGKLVSGDCVSLDEKDGRFTVLKG